MCIFTKIRLEKKAEGLDSWEAALAGVHPVHSSLAYLLIIAVAVYYQLQSLWSSQLYHSLHLLRETMRTTTLSESILGANSLPSLFPKPPKFSLSTCLLSLEPRSKNHSSKLSLRNPTFNSSRWWFLYEFGHVDSNKSIRTMSLINTQKCRSLYSAKSITSYF